MKVALAALAFTILSKTGKRGLPLSESETHFRSPARLRLAIISALVMLGAALYYFRSLETPLQNNARGGMSGPILVDAARVERRPLFSNITAIGTLLAQDSVILRPEIAGVLEAAPFREGQDVKKGDVLIRLDSDIQRAELAQANASAVLARANFQRAQNLGRSGAGTRQSFEQAQAELAVAEANVAAAQARAQKMELRSPIAGRVGILRVTPGNWVAAGEELVGIATLDPLKLDFSIPEIFLRQMRPGMPVTVTVDAMREEQFAGKITAIDPQADESTRSLHLRAQIANNGLKLRPGLFARVKVALGAEDLPLAVPETALVPLADKSFLFRVADGKAQRLEVKTGLRNEGHVEILSGANENDLIVTAGQMKLKDGAPVQIRGAPAGPQK